ncbi:hypothetical protein N9992_00805, partial [bacterium]|nr:hypothetical protein [bacterium]
ENDKLRVSTSYGYSLKSNADFRDTSAWYHLVFSIDTTQGTANNRVKVYVNGSEVTSWGTQSISISQNANNGMFNEVNGSHYFGWSDAQATGCYLAEAHCIDGQALAASDFGEYDEDSNIWKPKEYTGTYGNQGYYLDFKTSSNLGTDSSGNGNNFGSLYGIGAENQATDTPTNNFTTFNTLRRWNQGRISFTEGATVVNTVSGNTWTTVSNNIGVNKGKWYWEGELYAGGGYQMFGQNPVVSTEININADWYLGQYANKSAGAGYYGSGADVYYEGGYANSSANATGDIISVAMDCDNNKVHFAVNGVYTNSSNPVNNTNGFAMSDEYQYFAMATYIGSYAFKANFGGFTTISISSAASDADGYGTFEYAPPSGYYALCTKNLEEYG